MWGKMVRPTVPLSFSSFWYCLAVVFPFFNRSSNIAVVSHFGNCLGLLTVWNNATFMQAAPQQRSSATTVEVTQAEKGQRVDNFILRRANGVPRSHIYRIIRTGQVRVNGGRIKPTRKLAVGDKVRIPPMNLDTSGPVNVPERLLEELAPCIFYECDDFLALNKPAGLAVHGGSGLAFGAIDVLRQLKDEPKLELVHRLDKATSGCLLVARDNGVNRELQQLFRGREISKRYLALLDGAWRGGPKTETAPLMKNKEHAGERRVWVSDEGQSAVSHFNPKAVYANGTLMDIDIETGRTHQIRVHAKHNGHAVLGDTRYGDNRSNAAFKKAGFTRMYLHSMQLAFHWQGEDVVLNAPVDNDWQRAQLALERGVVAGER